MSLFDHVPPEGRPDALSTQIHQVVAELLNGLARYDGNVAPAALDSSVRFHWQEAEPETRACILLDSAMDHRTEPLSPGSGPAHAYARELHEAAAAFTGDRDDWRGEHWPLMPLPGGAGSLASSLAFDRDDLDVSLEAALTLMTMGWKQGDAAAGELRRVSLLERATQIPVVLSALTGAVERHWPELELAVHDQEAIDTWAGATHEARACILLNLAWGAREHGIYPQYLPDGTDDPGWGHVADLYTHAIGFEGTSQEFHGAGFPAMPLPGEAGLLAMELGLGGTSGDEDQDEEELDGSLRVALLFLARVKHDAENEKRS
ncbi:hypothetical protein ACIBUR_39855 [Streptomyces anulatus]